MPIPEEIKKLKPQGLSHACEVRFLSGRYYVYEISSRWDEKKGRPQKTTGKCIGKIIESQGFIPNGNYISAYSSVPAITKCYGAIEMFRQMGPDISERIRTYFPDIYRQLETITLLRLVFKCRSSEMRYQYEHSCLMDVYPGIGLCEDSVSRVMTKLSMRRDAMVAFMKSFARDGHQLLFDGTSFFSGMGDSFASPGYNAQHSRDNQYRVLYIFDSTRQEPLFYRNTPGNIVDRSSFAATIEEAGVGNCIVVGDKGFYSKPNISYLMEKKIRFVLPLQSNTRQIPQEFDDNDSDSKFDGRFTFNGRNIWHKKLPVGSNGNYVYIFRDDKRRADENALATEKQEKSVGEKLITDEDYLSDRRRGVFAYSSNIDADAKAIYLTYKARWDIEEMFDYLKNSVALGPAYVRTNEMLEASSFINQLVLLYFYRLLSALKKAGLSQTHTPKEIIDHGRNIYKRISYADEREYISEMTDDDRILFEQLGVHLEIKSKNTDSKTTA